MKIIHKLKAIFVKEQQPIILDLAAAEIKAGRAYLHPKGNREATYLVKSDDIEIHLNRSKELSDDDIVILQKKEEIPLAPKVTKTERREMDDNSLNSGNPEEVNDRFKKRTFSVSLYQHEYDALMNTIKEYGYKRAEFIIASANTATRGTMERERMKIVQVHKEIRKEEKSVRATQKAT